MIVDKIVKRRSTTIISSLSALTGSQEPKLNLEDEITSSPKLQSQKSEKDENDHMKTDVFFFFEFLYFKKRRIKNE